MEKMDALLVKLGVAAVIGFGACDSRAQPIDECKVADVGCWVAEASIEWRAPYSVPGSPKLGITGETKAEHEARRRMIAAAAWEAAQLEDPLPMGGAGDRENRARGALFVASIWNWESAYHLYVQKHHCKGLDPSSCDGGAAWCLGQVHVGKSSELKALGWTGPDLDADPVKCARATIKVLATWARTCPNGKGADRFAGYAMGECGVSPKVRQRWAPAEAWWKGHPAP